VVLRYFSIILLMTLGSYPAWSASIDYTGVADFTNLSDNPDLDNYTRAIPTLIMTHLASTQKFSFVDRQALNEILDEIGLSQTGIVHPETAARVGRLVGAAYMFIGDLSDYQRKIRITTRLVHVESACVMAGWQIEASPKELDVQAVRLADKILKLMFPVSPWGAAGRSLLVPGWGQFANQRPSGYIFLPLAVAALGGLAYTHYACMDANDDYDKIWERYPRPAKDLKEAQDKIDKCEKRRWVAVGITAGVWLINVADAFLEARLLDKQRRYTEERLQVQMGMQDVRVLWATRF
jgi:TolB-like protein